MSCVVKCCPVHVHLNCFEAMALCSRPACILLRTLANGFRLPWMSWPHGTALWCSHHLEISGLGQACMCPAYSYPSGSCFCTRQLRCHFLGTLSASHCWHGWSGVWCGWCAPQPDQGHPTRLCCLSWSLWTPASGTCKCEAHLSWATSMLFIHNCSATLYILYIICKVLFILYIVL